MSIKTSDTHPIRVDWLDVPRAESVGMTFAPGMHAHSTEGGRWERDLKKDLERIANHWQGDVLVTLMEDHELVKYEMVDFAEAVRASGLQWEHVPIVDTSTPTSIEATQALVRHIVEWVDAGKRVVIHCRGGLGRTGTIAGCYLVHRGVSGDEALRMVAEARKSPRCPENETQRAFVRGFVPASPKPAPAAAPKREATPKVPGGRELLQAVEAYVRDHPELAFRRTASGALRLHCPPHSWSAGTFVTPTLAALRASLAGLPDAGSGSVTLSRLSGSKSELDVGRLQAEAAPGTLFQAASQFNCLESPGPYVTAVANYPSDNTQGPRASVSAFPGTFVRHYRCPGTDGETFVQSDERGFNLLFEAAPNGLSGVRSGYLEAGAVGDPNALAEALVTRFDEIRVGIQAGVEVVFGANWFGPVPPARKIDQVFTSTMVGSASSPAFTTIRRQLLRAAYLGTLLAALDLGDRRVVLTLIGGGVFGNPRGDIVEAIEWAVAEAAPIAASDLEVLVNDFDGWDELAGWPAVACSAWAGD